MVDIEFAYDEGGVTTPAGFRASGVHAGFRKDPKRLDAALVVSDGPDTVSCGMFTRNVFCAAPVQLDRELLVDHEPRAVLLNSGNANAATGEPGLAIARKSAQAACRALGLPDGEVLVASTGVIGVELPWAPFETGIPALVESLSPDGGHDAACAIMTTDTHPKEHALRFTHDGNEYAVGGMVKGSGMIQPDMATMLAVITTDMPVAPETMRSILQTAVDVSFNKVTVDSDTSTNDSVFFFSSGVGAPVADADTASVVLGEAVRIVCEDLARQIAADGEGATKLVTCTVKNSRSEETAERLAKAVVGSNLVKAAMFGADANWGRVLCAMGYSKAPFRPEYVDVAFESENGSVAVCEKGAALNFDEELAKKVLTANEVTIQIDVHEGEHAATAWGCDLTYDYVKINGDYRT